jgi:hypothetical protein
MNAFQFYLSVPLQDFASGKSIFPPLPKDPHPSLIPTPPSTPAPVRRHRPPIRTRPRVEVEPSRFSKNLNNRFNILVMVEN